MKPKPAVPPENALFMLFFHLKSITPHSIVVAPIVQKQSAACGIFHIMYSVPNAMQKTPSFIKKPLATAERLPLSHQRKIMMSIAATMSE